MHTDFCLYIQSLKRHWNCGLIKDTGHLMNTSYKQVFPTSCVLFLLGQLIFFIAAGMGLCVRFLLETVLVIEGCFSRCRAVLTQSQGLFCFSTHQWITWGCSRICEGAQPEQPTPADHRVIPYQTMSCSAYKAGWRRRKGRTSGVMAFVFPSNPYMWWSPAFLGMAELLPADRKEWTNSLVCFACVHGFCFIY